jgi:chromosome segregation ATPase
VAEQRTADLAGQLELSTAACQELRAEVQRLEEQLQRQAADAQAESMQLQLRAEHAEAELQGSVNGFASQLQAAQAAAADAVARMDAAEHRAAKAEEALQQAVADAADAASRLEGAELRRADAEAAAAADAARAKQDLAAVCDSYAVVFGCYCAAPGETDFSDQCLWMWVIILPVRRIPFAGCDDWAHLHFRPQPCT